MIGPAKRLDRRHGLLKIRPYMSHKPLEIERFDAKYPKSEAILVDMV